MFVNFIVVKMSTTFWSVDHHHQYFIEVFTTINISSNAHISIEGSGYKLNIITHFTPPPPLFGSAPVENCIIT